MKPSVHLTRRWPTSVEKSLAEKFNVTLNTEDVPYSTEQFRQALAEHDAVLTITVTNTPDVLSECTADIAIMLLLMIARRGGEAERELRGGSWTGWRPTHMIGAKVSGRTLGIVGFGRIGKETAKRALGFGMKVCVYNRSKVSAEVLSEFNAVQIESLEELATTVDFVSLHCPGGTETINSGLLKLDNVVLLPHLGSATDDTRDAMGYRVMENITAFFEGREPSDKVV